MNFILQELFPIIVMYIYLSNLLANNVIKNGKGENLYVGCILICKEQRRSVSIIMRNKKSTH